MKTPRLLLACALASLLTGCTALPQKIGKLNDTLKAIDTLGLKRVEIPGRATHTTYLREGNTSTLTHTNPALSGPIVIVRERPAEVTQ
jgi:hypothetical protein